VVLLRAKGVVLLRAKGVVLLRTSCFSGCRAYISLLPLPLHSATTLQGIADYKLCCQLNPLLHHTARLPQAKTTTDHQPRTHLTLCHTALQGGRSRSIAFT
jgi:hypothetical protein